MGRARHSASSARLPDFVEPMQAKLVHSIPPGDCLYEVKFDGHRALALRGGIETRILSRNKRIWARCLWVPTKARSLDLAVGTGLTEKLLRTKCPRQAIYPQF
jgi:ATP-dependent DNA ligase